MISNKKLWLTFLGSILCLLVPSLCLGIDISSGMANDFGLTTLSCFGIRWEIIIFILILINVAIFYKNTTDVAIIGVSILVLYKLFIVPDFTLQTLSSPKYITTYLDLINLAGMLLGFSILADNFEKSNLPYKIPKILPNNTLGGIILLGIVFFISSFLDNIASAMIGCTIAHVIFNKKIHIGYAVAIVAASNAGGAGSVVGDTTTTLMWLKGYNPLDISHAYIPAIFAFIIFSYFASKQQLSYAPMITTVNIQSLKIDWVKLSLVLFILVMCITTNAILSFPALGIWIAIYIGKFFTKIDWKITPENLSSTIFLLVLVFSANLIPLGDLPSPTNPSTFVIGLVSGVFNNIPLTQLCLEQGGYNYALLSFAVGFGGSMVWFGSSAGVAVCDIVPKARSIITWIKYGWHTTIAYIIAFWLYVFLLQIFN
ncbi:MAG: citrate transporter [Succinivibrionaceae bacterium]